MRDKNLDMSLVFKLNSVDDLGRLHKAMETSLTLQEEIKLKGDVMKLEGLKHRLENEIQLLRSEIVAIDPTRAEKLNEKLDMTDKEADVEETEMPVPEEGSNRSEVERLVEEVEAVEESAYIQDGTERERTSEV